MKKIFAGLTIALMMMFTISLVQANDIGVIVDGKEVRFDGQRPQVVLTWMVVPIRNLFEHMGYSVTMNPQNMQQVILSNNINKMVLTLGNQNFTVNGEVYRLYHINHLQVVRGTIMVSPLIVEALGYDWEWNPHRQRFYIATRQRDQERDTPSYITIRGVRFSTALTELNLSRLTGGPEFDFGEGPFRLTSEDLAPLRYMTNLTLLDFSFQDLTDLSFLAELTGLTRLYLDHTGITDISPLASLANLTGLSLSGEELTDISPLAELTNLTTLHLTWSNVTDFSPLARLTNLTTLNLFLNNITDISPLAELTNLTTLYLTWNDITDISHLARLTNLTTLFLSGNNIADINSLAGLYRLVNLHLENNHIADVSSLHSLANLDELRLLGNPLNLTTFDDWAPFDHVWFVDIRPVDLHGSPVIRVGPQDSDGPIYAYGGGGVKVEFRITSRNLPNGMYRASNMGSPFVLSGSNIPFFEHDVSIMNNEGSLAQLILNTDGVSPGSHEFILNLTSLDGIIETSAPFTVIVSPR